MVFCWIILWYIIREQYWFFIVTLFFFSIKAQHTDAWLVQCIGPAWLYNRKDLSQIPVSKLCWLMCNFILCQLLMCCLCWDENKLKLNCRRALLRDYKTGIYRLQSQRDYDIEICLFRTIEPARGQEVNFLFEEILFDLREVSSLIGRSVDDAFSLMHLIFNRMRISQVGNHTYILLSLPTLQQCDATATVLKNAV